MTASAGIHEVLPSPPRPGTALEVVPDLYWARLPLQGFIDHVNAWLLADAEGWSLIECGTDSAPVRVAWAVLGDTVLADRPVRRLVATHGHSDHIGFAGPLGVWTGLPIVMPRGEWLQAGLRRLQARLPPAEDRAHDFFRRHGCGDAAEALLKGGRRQWAELVAELPPLAEIRDGDELEMGGRSWRVIVTGGHAPEHAAFWCARDCILIAGDHVLPNSSPSIGVFWSEPEADPLGAFLAGLEVFARLPEDCLVLPSHGAPYRGLAHRIGELRALHERRMAEVMAAAGTGSTAYDIACRILAKPMRDGRGRLALPLVIAHLNHLVARGALVAEDDADGLRRFRLAGGLP